MPVLWKLSEKSIFEFGETTSGVGKLSKCRSKLNQGSATKSRHRFAQPKKNKTISDRQTGRKTSPTTDRKVRAEKERKDSIGDANYLQRAHNFGLIAPFTQIAHFFFSQDLAPMQSTHSSACSSGKKRAFGANPTQHSNPLEI
jgi:hypothetical protein